ALLVTSGISVNRIAPRGPPLVDGRSIGPGLVNLPYHSIRSLANAEVEPDLCLPRPIADDVGVARHLARPDHSAEGSVENSVEDSGLAALVETRDEDDPV